MLNDLAHFWGRVHSPKVIKMQNTHQKGAALRLEKLCSWCSESIIEPQSSHQCLLKSVMGKKQLVIIMIHGK